MKTESLFLKGYGFLFGQNTSSLAPLETQWQFLHSSVLVLVGRNWKQHTNIILWLGYERAGAPPFFFLFEGTLATKPSRYFWQMYILPKQKA